MSQGVHTNTDKTTVISLFHRSYFDRSVQGGKGVINNINDGSIQVCQFHNFVCGFWLSGMGYQNILNNRAIINIILSFSCAFRAMTNENICCETDLLSLIDGFPSSGLCTDTHTDTLVCIYDYWNENGRNSMAERQIVKALLSSRPAVMPLLPK